MSLAIAASIRPIVRLCTPGRPLIARSTVAIDTLASRATSSKVTLSATIPMLHNTPQIEGRNSIFVTADKGQHAPLVHWYPFLLELYADAGDQSRMMSRGDDVRFGR